MSGTKDPNAELRPITRLLLMDTPRQSTLRPNAMAPKPHAKPKPSAAASAFRGALTNKCLQAGVVQPTIAIGIAMQETKMKPSQRFSHFQRDSSFIGVVNNPLQTPDNVAKKMPARIISVRESRLKRPAPKCCSHSVTGAHSREHNQVALFELSGSQGILRGQRNGGCSRVAVAIDIDEHLFAAQTQTF